MLSKLKLKYIQSLGQKKFRDEHRVFVAEGPKAVAELLSEDKAEIREIFAVSDWLETYHKLTSKAQVHEITKAELERISSLSTPNQVLAIISQFSLPPEPAPVSGEIVLALDLIQDPGNLGTIIRIADWFGVKRIVCNTGSAEIYNPKVVQSTMGSIARVEVYYTDLQEWLSAQEEARIYATTLEGEDITEMKKINSGIILIGNESRGISSQLMELANVRITIPRVGKAESLNAAVATGVVLSHLLT